MHRCGEPMRHPRKKAGLGFKDLIRIKGRKRRPERRKELMILNRAGGLKGGEKTRRPFASQRLRTGKRRFCGLSLGTRDSLLQRERRLQESRRIGREKEIGWRNPGQFAGDNACGEKLKLGRGWKRYVLAKT